MISNAASLAGVALIGAEYIVQVLFPGRHDTSHIQVIIAISSIILFYGINLLGLKMSARTQNLLTMIKSGMIPAPDHPGLFVTDTPATLETIGRPSGPEKNTSVHSVSVGGGIFYIRGYQQTINFGKGQQPFEKHTRGSFSAS